MSNESSRAGASNADYGHQHAVHRRYHASRVPEADLPDDTDKGVREYIENSFDCDDKFIMETRHESNKYINANEFIQKEKDLNILSNEYIYALQRSGAVTRRKIHLDVAEDREAFKKINTFPMKPEILKYSFNACGFFEVPLEEPISEGDIEVYSNKNKTRHVFAHTITEYDTDNKFWASSLIRGRIVERHSQRHFQAPQRNNVPHVYTYGHVTKRYRFNEIEFGRWKRAEAKRQAEEQAAKEKRRAERKAADAKKSHRST